MSNKNPTYREAAARHQTADELFDCGMNTLNQSVSWAHIKTGPPVTDDDANYLRARGYCSEP